jgi:TP901 family phage tail tape measure protein
MAFGSSSLGFGIAFNLKDGFSKNAKSIQTGMSGLSKGAGKLTAGANEVGSSFTKNFGSLAMITAISAPFVKGISASMEFNKEMSKVRAITGASGVDFDNLNAKATELGETTMFSASEAAQGMTNLGMAGFKTNEIISAMPGVLDLAAAGNVTLAQSADIASNVLSGFGLKASETDRIVDIMAKTATSANTDIIQYGESMKMIAPMASALGVSIEETSAMIGILGNSGMKGTMATTALKTSMARLANPTNKMRESMNKYNIDAFDAQGNFIGMAGLLEQMSSGFKGVTKEQQIAAISTIFGNNASAQMLSLFKETTTVVDGKTVAISSGADALAKYTKELENSGGAAKTMADIMMDNLGGDVTSLGSRMEAMWISIGQALEPVSRMVVQLVSKLVAGFTWFLGTGVGKFFVGLAGAIAAATSALMLYSMVTTFMATPAMTTFAGAVNLALWPIVLMIGSIALLVGGFIYLQKASNKALVGMVALMLLLGGPLGMIVVSIALLKRGFTEFNNVMEGAEAQGGVIGFLTKIAGTIKGVIAIWKSATGEGFTLSKKMHDGLQSIGILRFVLALGTWVVRIKTLFKGIKAGIIDGFVTPFKSAFVELGAILTPVFDSLMSALDSLGWSFGKAGGEMETFYNIGKFIGTVLPYVIAPILFAFRAVIFVIKGAVSSFLWLRDTIMSVWAKIAPIISTIKDGVGGVIGTVGGFLGVGGDENESKIQGVNADNSSLNNATTSAIVAKETARNANSGNSTTNNYNSEPITVVSKVELDSEVIYESLNNMSTFKNSIGD